MLVYVLIAIGPGSEEFTVELHHGGFFVGHGIHRAYVDQKVDWFDHCERDTWSGLWLDDFLVQLGHERTAELKMYWLLPGMELENGLRIIDLDHDTNVMASVVHKVRNLVVYVDHNGNIGGDPWDDVVANPIATLPKVFSPRKVVHGEMAAKEKLPDFYNNIKEKKGLDEGEGQECDSDSECDSDDIVEDPDFVDIDFELEEEDADLFADSIDVDVIDECSAKWKRGKKAAVRNNLRGQESSSHIKDDLSTDDEGIELPASDDEDGRCSLRFKSFGPEDMQDPSFKVGQVFESVVVLRKAITEYSMRHRVEIKMPKNDRKRFRAYCADGCPWHFHASEDSRVKSFIVKTYCGEHNCQKEWVLKSDMYGYNG
ncbi:hypothetical protein ACP4OV_015038 [Aristida adscensionis]